MSSLTSPLSNERFNPPAAQAVHAALIERWGRAAAGKRVLLVESADYRVREAARQLTALGVRPVFLSGPAASSPMPVETMDAPPASDMLHAAGLLLADGAVDACVAGAVTSSPEVLRAALHTVGGDARSALVSSLYLMLLPDGRAVGYADCVVNHAPDAAMLARIAHDSAATFTRLTEQPARVAMLSYSTCGTAPHEAVSRVREAVALTRSLAPRLVIEGEMQFDAATVPEIAQLKLPGSRLAGDANVLVFPNLDAANIAYKITERLGGAIAAGPVIQGLRRPYFDVSRGCDADDVVRLALLAAILSGPVP